MKLHEMDQMNKGLRSLMSQTSKNENEIWDHEWEACINLVRKTIRERRLRAPYQSFDGRNLKSTCIKVGRRKKWTPLSLGSAHANGEERAPLWCLKRHEGEV